MACVTIVKYFGDRDKYSISVTNNADLGGVEWSVYYKKQSTFGFKKVKIIERFSLWDDHIKV